MNIAIVGEDMIDLLRLFQEDRARREFEQNYIFLGGFDTLVAQ